MGRLPVGGWWVDVAAALAVNAFACDHDFETPGGRLLEDYGTVLLVGHSEYWSKHQRDQLDEFVDNGGNLAIFGGNTAYWKVRWEDDGCPIRFEHGLPTPGDGVGIPPNLEIIGIAPAALLEPPDNPYGEIIPPEDPETLAGIAHGRSDAAGIERLNRGHAVMAGFERDEGQVFNTGTTEWAHGLEADPFVARITSNVLDRFLGRRPRRPG